MECAYRSAVTTTTRLTALLGTALLFNGCVTGIGLTNRGSHVQNVSQADAPLGCELMGDVAIGIPPDAGRPRTEEQLVTLMRNKAGEVGGTHVVVDFSEQRTGAGGEPYYVGRGRAYACHGTPETAPHEEREPIDDEVPPG